MTAQEQYQEVIQRIESRIIELKEGNAADQQQLSEIERQYEEAVTAFDSNTADKLHAKMSTIRQNMDNRSRQIAILAREDNPTRAQAADVYIKALKDEKTVVKEKAKQLEGKAHKARQAYMNALKDIAEVNKEYKQVSGSYNKASNRFFGTNLNTYGTDNIISLHQFEVNKFQIAQNLGGTN